MNGMIIDCFSVLGYTSATDRRNMRSSGRTTRVRGFCFCFLPLASPFSAFSSISFLTFFENQAPYGMRALALDTSSLLHSNILTSRCACAGFRRSVLC